MHKTISSRHAIREAVCRPHWIELLMKDRMIISVRRRIMLDADLDKRRIRCANSWRAHQPRLWVDVAISLKQSQISIVKGNLQVGSAVTRLRAGSVPHDLVPRSPSEAGPAILQ